jgi:hypothetical protein
VFVSSAKGKHLEIVISLHRQLKSLNIMALTIILVGKWITFYKAMTKVYSINR